MARLDKRWIVALVLLVAVLIVGRGLGDEHRFAELVRGAQPAWMLVMLVAQGATYVILAAAWRVAIRRAGGAAPHYLALTRLALAELFADQAVPSGGVGGTFLVVRGLRRRGVEAPASAAAVVASLLGLYAAQILGVVASVVVLVLRKRFVHLAIVVSGVSFAASLAVPVVVIAIVEGALPRLPRRVQELGFVRLLRESLGGAPRGVVTAPRTLAPITAIRLAIIALDGVTLACASGAFGHPLPVDEAVVAVLLASVAGSLSFLPGALGSFEALATALLTLFGQSLELAVSSVLLMRGFSFWLPMLPGLWFARQELNR